MRARLDIEGAVGRADVSFFQLLHTVRTGQPAYPLAADSGLEVVAVHAAWANSIVELTAL